jgi:hypothetical protein
MSYRYITELGLSSLEVDYWKRMALSNMKIAVEIESEFRSLGVISGLSNNLRPTNSITDFGTCGISTVKGDGSLLRGAETCTVGRRFSFIDLYEQYKYIINKMIEYEPYISPRAGMHNHFLLDYAGAYSCLEKPMPGIILKNFLQLIKRYGPCMVWITSTIKHNIPGVITRKYNFCNHTSLYSTAIPSKTAAEIRRVVYNGDRYRFINLIPLITESSNEDNIKIFHVELRYPDCSLFPAQMAAQNILHAALLYKAIELSEHGIIACSDNEDDWTEIKRLMNAIRTDDYTSGDRVSAPLSQNDVELVRSRSEEMIKELKSAIYAVDKNAYPILKQLAYEPISKMQFDVRTTEGVKEVNEFFNLIVSSIYDVSTNPEYKDLVKTIITMSIVGATSEAQWVYKAQTTLSKDAKEIENKLTMLKLQKDLKFDLELGTYVFG